MPGQRWEVTPDFMHWTFHLRKGVTFHDGAPMDAQAVVFSLLRQRSEVRSKGGGRRYFFWETAFSEVQNLRATGPLTVVFDLKRPHAPFLMNLAMYPASIVSPRVASKQGGGLAQHPVGPVPSPSTPGKKGG